MNKEEIDKSSVCADLIYLVSCSVNGQIPDAEKCASMNLPEIFQMALRHSLTVAAALAYEQTAELPDYFKEEKFKAIRRLALFDVERAKILRELEKNHIPYMPLKGIVMRELYPKTVMREMSDNDIWFASERKADVKEIMSALNYSCSNYEKIHHDVYIKNSFLEFEMHRDLFDKDGSPLLYDYFQNIKSRLIKDSGNEYGYHMSPEDFYLFLICHLYKHYESSGTGLRSLLDVYVFLKAKGEGLNFEYINKELETLNLRAFEKDVRELSYKAFTLADLSEEERRELSYYVDSNTHGTLDNLMARQLNNDDSARSKLNYLLHRVFPSKKNIKMNHPVVYRHKALYPLLIFYRPIKGLVKHRKIIINEVKRLKSYKSK